MTALSTNQKSTRVFRLLRGMSSPPVLALLAPRGCTPEVLAEGWDLLRKANSIRLVKSRETAIQPASDRLSGLQATWFPLADATLEARYPAVHERVFRNLGRGTGADLYVATQTFHDRIEALFASSDATDQEASALLQQRGLTPAVIANLAFEIERFKTFESNAGSVDALEAEKAERELAKFYVEWSKIVRSAVKDRRLLLAMGFLRRKGVPAVEVPVTAGATPQPVVTPTIVPTAMIANPTKSNGASSNGAVVNTDRTMLA